MHRRISQNAFRNWILLSADSVGGAGGGEPKKPQTLAEAKARCTELEAELQTEKQRAESERQRAETEKQRADAAEAEVTKLQGQFDEATKTAAEARARAEKAEQTAAAEKLRADAAEGREAKANANIARLEKLCDVKGVNPATTAPAGDPDPEPKTITRAEFDKLSHSERQKFFRDGGRIDG